MAIPTYATVISQINTYIVANGNNEITANVLNPILKVITDFANNTIGELTDLNTTDTNTVVAAINSLKLAFDNLNNNGVQLLTGYDDPNVTPPPTFNYADFYMELDVTDDSPIQLWQWSGSEWTTYSSVYSKAEIDAIVTAIYDSIAEIVPVGYVAENEANKISEITGYSEVEYPNEKATHDALDFKLNISDLPTNLILYPTTTVSDVSGYVVMVTDIHDVRYDEPAVDVSIPAITTTAQLVSSRISDAGVLIGQPGIFNVTAFGNIRRLSGSGTATFYFEVYHRDLAGTETLIGQSSNSAIVSSSSYLEFTTSMVWNDGDFIETDRIVVKTYSNRIGGGTDPVYQFQFGGVTPVRLLLPVPFSVVDAGYELKANKVNVYTEDGTGEKYYTADYINDVLPKDYAVIVYVNSTNPSTATIFDDENPPVTNNPALEDDVDNLYIGTDSSTWVYNGSIYTTKAVPDTSNFYMSGTMVDAGNDKNSPINREGPIFVMTPGDQGISIYKDALSFWRYITGVPKTVNVFFDNITNNYGVNFPNKAEDSTETFAMMSDVSEKQNIANTPIETGTSFSLNNTYNGKIVIFTASCTLTIPNGLMAGFNATFVTLAGVTLTVALGGSVVLFNNVGTTLAEKSSFTLQARTLTNNYITAGSL